jgi:hypothetical protein
MIIVFTGPTLSPEEARAELDAVYLAPASQGDVYSAALERPAAIGIVDGYFSQVPSVWHKEILWAMREGIHVFGSASMGALRAAELWPFGMVGVGAVFEAFRDGDLEDDDEVAVLHMPALSGFRPLSEPMVNIRATLAAAEADGLISRPTQLALEGAAKDLFYPERSYERMLERARELGLPKTELEELARRLPDVQIDQKRLDALAMLRAMREFLASDPGPKTVDYEFEHTTLWNQLARDSGRLGVGGNGVRADDALLELERDETLLREAVDAATFRLLALDEARRHGFVVGEEEVAAAILRFRAERRLADWDDLTAWLAENDLDREAFIRLMAAEAQIEWARSMLRSEAGDTLLDVLRITGDYPRVRNRLRDR